MKKISVSLCFMVILGFFSLCATETQTRSFVTCSLCGQLGNQLFEVAATLAHAWDHHSDPIFPDLNRSDSNIPMNRNRIFSKLNKSPLPRAILHTFNDYSTFLWRDIPYQTDQLLEGYFLLPRYFHHHREKLLENFAPTDEELENLKFKHAAILNHPLTVGIHVRTFNKEWNDRIPFIGMDYYEEAIGHFSPEALFIVFSDRINWCKHHFRHIKRPFIFIEDQDHVADLFLMSMLKHNIIGNSSYSWWGAYLNRNPDKIVISPAWFFYPHSNPKGINPSLPEWIIVDSDITRRYPDDMRDYDTYSKSMDTQ